MKNQVIIVALYLFVMALNLTQAQVTQEWVAHESDAGPGAIKYDGNGSIYVTGSILTGSSNDYLTTKYNTHGVQQWSMTYNGPGNSNDNASALTVDDSGNVYITGTSDGECATIKYNAAGVQKWISRYRAYPGYSSFSAAIVRNNSGDIFITGTTSSISNGFNVITVKYNSSGVQQWARIYDAGGADGVEKICADKKGNVYIVGSSYYSLSNNDYLLIKYSSSGIERWLRNYNGAGNGFDHATCVAADDSGNIIISGQSLGIGTLTDFTTIKYDSLGFQKWLIRYNNSSNQNDIANAIVIDKEFNIYVTGQSIGSSTQEDYATVKYNSSGVEQWVRRYNGPGNNFDAPLSIIVDQINNIYVTGFSTVLPGNHNYTTIKYDALGSEQWNISYDGAGRDDEAFSMSQDDSGNVYVTGISSLSPTLSEMATVKYSQISAIRMNIKCLFEAMYYPNFNQMSRKDNVKAYLRNSSSPFNIVDSALAIIDSLSFTGSFTFPNADNGRYYLDIKHLNTIETWSKAGGELLINNGTVYFYDFTSTNTNSYGNNMKLKGSKYCFYSGDVEEFGFIDVSDLAKIYNDATQTLSGNYLISDLNADGFVDSADLIVCFNNSRDCIGIVRP